MSSRGDGAREEGGRRREEEEEQERAKGRKEGGEGRGRHSGPGDRDSRERLPCLTVHTGPPGGAGSCI